MNPLRIMKVCRILIVVLVIKSYSTAQASMLQAPYLISATSVNGHSVTLTWRNNDFTATQIIVLRKTSTTSWSSIDSVVASVTSYKDSSLQPLTNYSFALLAVAPGLLSDTSNVLTATTPEEIGVFVAPRISLTWVEGKKFITVSYFDSSNIEEGFRLFRKVLSDSWAAIDSVPSSVQDTIGWKSFSDSTIQENKWYSYKVQIYNDSQSAFSAETTVYNYAPPKKNKSYVLVNRSSIPAQPISWVERIGDSLFFPEVAGLADTAITVIDVSNSASPRFRTYINPQNVPAWLTGSVVEARLKIPSTGSLFSHRNGYYLVSRGNKLYQYDSASLSLYDSIAFPEVYYREQKQIGWLNDSCCLVAIRIDSVGSDCGVWPINFNVNGIDTFPCAISWHNWSTMGHYYLRKAIGCYNNFAVFCSQRDNNIIGVVHTYIMQDFSTGYHAPLIFSENVPVSLYSLGYVQSPVFDTNIVFSAIGSGGISGINLYAYNISDAHSGQSYLGKLVDTNCLCGDVKQILVDNNKRCFYVIGDKGISIYTYSIGPASIRNSSVSKNALAQRLLIMQSSKGVYISIIGDKIASIQVLNVKGQIIRSANVPVGETYVWNKRDNSGRAVPVGLYIYKIGTLKNGVMVKSTVLVR